MIIQAAPTTSPKKVNPTAAPQRGHKGQGPAGQKSRGKGDDDDDRGKSRQGESTVLKPDYSRQVVGSRLSVSNPHRSRVKQSWKQHCNYFQLNQLVHQLDSHGDRHKEGSLCHSEPSRASEQAARQVCPQDLSLEQESSQEGDGGWWWRGAVIIKSKYIYLRQSLLW